MSAAAPAMFVSWQVRHRRWAFCRINPERPMSATISPPLVQPAFGLGNLMWAGWLALRGLSGQTTTEDIQMFARRNLHSSISRAAVMATLAAVALTSFE